MDADHGFLSVDELKSVVSYYESIEPGIEEGSVRTLTYSRYKEPTALVDSYWQECKGEAQPSHCVLTKYWRSEETGLRVLALFYDTGTLVQATTDDLRSFSPDQIRAIEKSIRKLPIHVRQRINQGTAVGPAPYVNGTTPLKVIATDQDGNIGDVFMGQTRIDFWDKGLDQGRSGQAFRDIGYRFLADFRLQFILHEVGHVIDGTWTPTPEGMPWEKRTVLTRTPELAQLINSSLQAKWANHWFRAYSEGVVVQDERYIANPREKFAEFFAQYMLMPADLKTSAPKMYDWMKTTIFNGIEFEGYEKCGDIVKPLSESELQTAPYMNPENAKRAADKPQN